MIVHPFPGLAIYPEDPRLGVDLDQRAGGVLDAALQDDEAADLPVAVDAVEDLQLVLHTRQLELVAGVDADLVVADPCHVGADDDVDAVPADTLGEGL